MTTAPRILVVTHHLPWVAQAKLPKGTQQPPDSAWAGASPHLNPPKPISASSTSTLPSGKAGNVGTGIGNLHHQNTPTPPNDDATRGPPLAGAEDDDDGEDGLNDAAENVISPVDPSTTIVEQEASSFASSQLIFQSQANEARLLSAASSSTHSLLQTSASDRGPSRSPASPSHHHPPLDLTTSLMSSVTYSSTPLDTTSPFTLPSGNPQGMLSPNTFTLGQTNVNMDGEDPHRLGYSWDGILETASQTEEIKSISYSRNPIGPSYYHGGGRINGHSPLATPPLAVNDLHAGSLPTHDYGDALMMENASAAQVPEIPPEEWDWIFSRRSGHSALYSGIQALSNQSMASPALGEGDVSQGNSEILHIGWLGQIFDPQNRVVSSPSTNVQATLTNVLKTKNCIPVFMDDRVSECHYEGYCKSDLWPLLHYVMWTTNSSSAMNSTNNAENWDAYVRANKIFADLIISLYHPGDLIFVNDYHLLLVPSMLRAALPRATIGFFLHTPFPSSELFRCLPRRKEILSGVLGSNLIGFQTYAYARHFISSCTRVLGCESTPAGVDYNGFVVTVGTFPIGIDIDRVHSRRKTPQVLEKMAAIRDLYVGKKIIIGRDKLDHIKGVEHKLNAFEKFLELYPEWENRVVLIQVTTPSLKDSTKLQAKVSELVSRINGSWGSLEFAPVHHYHHHLNQDEYFALLSVADVGLITSVRDGMNTTSHEYVVCQKENQGPLVLSEFTGTAGSLPSAILVNPWDYLGVASAINEALTLSQEERAVKHTQLYDFVMSNTASFWARSFVKHLYKTGSLTDTISLETPPLSIPKILQAYASSKRRLLMFDYDGTLTPIVKIPTDALPSPELLQALRVLVADPCNIVYIISGRDQHFLDTWLGDIPGLGFSAEHGCFTKAPGSNRWTCYTQDMEASHARWKEEVMEIFTYFSERTIGSFVEEKRASLTWHYRLADPEYGAFQAKECQNHLENAILSKLPVEVLVGKKNLEVRPISVNKGGTVKRLISAMSAGASMSVASALTLPKVIAIEGTASVGSRSSTPDGVHGMENISSSSDATSHSLPSPTTSTAAISSGGPDFCFCIGDDRTDEDMFRSIRKSDLPESTYFTCTVGPGSKKTFAQWHLTTPADVITLLSQGFAPLSTAGAGGGGGGSSCGFPSSAPGH